MTYSKTSRGVFFSTGILAGAAVALCSAWPPWHGAGGGGDGVVDALFLGDFVGFVEGGLGDLLGGCGRGFGGVGDVERALKLGFDLGVLG